MLLISSLFRLHNFCFSFSDFTAARNPVRVYITCWLCQGFRHTYHDVLGLVATYAMAYDCIVVRAYACCHLSRYIISVVFCSLISLVVSASLNSQYNWVSPWFWLRPVHYRTSDQDYLFTDFMSNVSSFRLIKAKISGKKTSALIVMHIAEPYSYPITP